MPLLARQLSAVRTVHIHARLRCEMVGKPDKVSNIRPLKYPLSEKTPPAEQELQELRIATQEWHHRFWLKHNASFEEAKRKFVESKMKNSLRSTANTGQALDPEEMAVFHKNFLRENQAENFIYDREWRQRNRRLLLLAMKAQFEKFHAAFKQSWSKR